MADKLSGEKIARLCDSANKSLWVLQQLRKPHRDCAKHLAGSRYADNGLAQTEYANLVGLAHDIYLRSLISRNPRVMLRTFNRRMQPAVTAMERWANLEFEKIGFANILERSVSNALCSMGIAKIGIATPAESARVANRTRAGTPFISYIDVDDYLCDVFKNDLAYVDYEGHRARVNLDVIKADPSFVGRKDLQPSRYKTSNISGDMRSSSIYNDEGWSGDEFEDMIDIWELYLPQYGCIVTLLEEEASGLTGRSKRGGGIEPLCYKKWVGPPKGPYRKLALKLIPGNIMPKGPLQDLLDMDIEFNRFLRKLIVQGQQQRSLIVGEDEKEIMKVLNSADQRAIRTDNPKGVQSVEYGGVNQSVMALTMTLDKLYDRMGGNLSTLGGLQQQAGTATQEQLLAQNANGLVTGMQDKTMQFVRDCAHDILWLHWYHPEQTMETDYEAKGVRGYGIQRKLYPYNHPGDFDAVGQWSTDINRRDGEWEEIALQIDPYSMVSKTPQQRSAQLKQFLMQIAVPLAPLFQQNGIVPDAVELIELLAQLDDMPDYTRCWTSAPPVDPEAQAQQETQQPQQQGPREVIRRSEGNPDANAQMEMDNMLASGQGNWNGPLQLAGA